MTSPGRRRVLAAGHLAVVIAVVAAGVASLTRVASTADHGVLLHAAQATESASTFRLTFALRLGGQDFTSEGVVDTANKRALLRIAIPGVERPVTAIYDGDFFYMDGPAVPAGRRWIRSRAATASLSPLGSGFSSALAFLRSASEDVTVLGVEEVRGVTTTRYRFNVDARKLQPGDASGAVGPVRIDAWIDEGGLLRRIDMQASLPQGVLVNPRPRGPDDLTLRASMEFYDFGVAVDIELPPPEEVWDQGD